ncbi:MAG TPA: selenide, water dikinase SelD [Flavobacteriales bacterium]|nr:selenide, water dikinase SelD [Flavobacteriales bacterium]HRO38419.1 selenide, water dikinase SelD [Flavobacteriales bacterium]HRP80625.1 selenide, water dikinase SelD [Flavobacteriales bacterium]
MTDEQPPPVLLTQYSHGAGCGCKIAPNELEKILKGAIGSMPDPKLLVGFQTRDDAAVYDIGDGRAVISTTDFFMPIVDDAFDFGRIAATNALSDVYAMGGKPLMAVAILGWPLEKLGAPLAARVVDGGRKACLDAGIPLAGGHTIDAPEPFFGLAVTGEVEIRHLKRNDSACEGDVLLLTKPIGVGVLSTARKRGILRPEHGDIARDLMVAPNAVGAMLGRMEGVHALTDVTGFGLLGHLLEMCKGSGLAATINYADVPVIPESAAYVKQGCYADGALRNWNSLAQHVEGKLGMEPLLILNDPQTSGGLLVACNPLFMDEITSLVESQGGRASMIGRMLGPADEKFISVEMQ